MRNFWCIFQKPIHIPKCISLHHLHFAKDRITLSHKHIASCTAIYSGRFLDMSAKCVVFLEIFHIDSRFRQMRPWSGCGCSSMTGIIPNVQLGFIVCETSRT